MRETWYVLEDGTAADPNECAPDDMGGLIHRSGAKVAMRGQVPSSRGVDPEEERAKGREMRPEPERPAEPKRYKTRAAKAE